MLSSADRELTRRDRALPGLAVVLDEAALADRLAAVLPGLTGVHVDYVRYKQGTSVIASVRLTGAGGSGHAFAAAYRRGRARDKLSKVTGAGAWRPHLDTGVGLAVAPAEADRTLPGIRKLLARPGLLGGGIDRLEPVRYNPARRWVALARGDGGVRQLVKVHARGQAAAAVRAARALPALRAAGVPLPRPRRRDVRRGIVALDWIQGTPLDEQDVDRSVEVGQLLAALHGADSADSSGGGRPRAAAATLRPAVTGVAAVAPCLATTVQRVAASCEAALRATAAPARLVHGDFSADQVIVTPDGLWLTDLDRMRLDDPACDLGSYAAAEISRHGGRAQDTDPVRAFGRLLDSYRAAGGDVAAGAFRAQTAAALLRRAVEPFRRREEDWPRRVRALVEAAAAMVGEG